MEVPEIFVVWWTKNTASNVDLANLSNVNRNWRRIVVQTILEQAQEVESTSSRLLLPTMVRGILDSGATTRTESLPKPHERDAFCAAWFHPAGIQIQQLSVAGDVWDYENETLNGSFAPSGAPFYAGSDEEQRPRNSPRGRSLLRRQQEGPLCSHEWQGYREPMDVLEPFGYAEHFVQTVLSIAQEQSDMGREQNDVASESLEENERQSNGILAEPSRPDLQTTIAVRGATLARPEGYCLCWDSSDAAAVYVNRSNDNWKAESKDGYLRSVMVRKRRHQILQREVLPRVLLSSKHKDLLNVNAKSKQQPCLQFLNSTGSNAVRLFTPPFECGPLEGPITLFLVGIATEDGCFVSGLNHRCELGHMHPLSLRDAMIDMSPVCIATDYRRTDPHHRPGSPSESLKAGRSQSGRSGGEDSESGDDSDDSSCALDTSREDGIQCQCEFKEASTRSWDEQDEEPPEECIYRGQRGPGSWHCYVCIFDKEDSVIRIDGAAEPLEKGCCQDSPPAAVLDGLTIGSDHCFDMSLCLGDASIEEGEGAISEVAVFKGRMSDTDIEHLEGYLMHKHGIAKLKPAERATLVRQDEWKRQGRALIAQPSPWSMRAASGVPLPIMARDRDVSWHRVNAVTGKDVRVSRIGSKFSNGSSDW